MTGGPGGGNEHETGVPPMVHSNINDKSLPEGRIDWDLRAANIRERFYRGDTMHPSTFGYLAPTEDQKAVMSKMREAASAYADDIEEFVPSGPDKTYLLRKLREVAMWVNVALTRQPDGAPRE